VPWYPGGPVDPGWVGGVPLPPHIGGGPIYGGLPPGFWTKPSYPPVDPGYGIPVMPPHVGGGPIYGGLPPGFWAGHWPGGRPPVDPGWVGGYPVPPHASGQPIPLPIQPPPPDKPEQGVDPIPVGDKGWTVQWMNGMWVLVPPAAQPPTEPTPKPA